MQRSLSKHCFIFSAAGVHCAEREESPTYEGNNSAWVRSHLADSIYLWACGEKAAHEKDEPKTSDRLIGWLIRWVSQAEGGNVSTHPSVRGLCRDPIWKLSWKSCVCVFSRYVWTHERAVVNAYFSLANVFQGLPFLCINCFYR